MKTFRVQIECPAGCLMKLSDLPSAIRHLQVRHEGWIEGMDDGDGSGASTIEVSVRVSMLDDAHDRGAEPVPGRRKQAL